MSALVLISSTNPEVRMRLRHLAESEGAVALLAPDASDAMRLVALREPDLIVLDAVPDPKLGLDLCRELKGLHVGHRLIVIVIASQGSRAAAFAAGCDAFVLDQRDERPLVRSVRRFLAVIHRPPRSTMAIALSP